MRGELLAVVTTDALELGIDIGALDAAVCVTFPGTVASLRQMWGRAGRRAAGWRSTWPARTRSTSSSAAIPTSSSTGRWRRRSSEHENEQIHLAHLLCAAHEAPLGGEDAEILGPRWRRHAERLVSQGELVSRGGRFCCAAPEDYPAARVSLRSASPDAVRGRRRRLRRAAGDGRDRARALDRARRRGLPAPRALLRGARARPRRPPRARRALRRATGTRSPRRRPTVEIEQLLDRRRVLGVTLSFGLVR